jgi:sulfatase maturation enzyme AslB (radical SAM superfamily)
MDARPLVQITLARAMPDLPPILRETPEHHEKPQTVGPVKLLVLQGTAFCNINCRYCYLPDRGNRARMSPTTLETVIARVAESESAKKAKKRVWECSLSPRM